MTPGPLGSLIDYVKNQTNALGELMQGSRTYDKYIPGIEKINHTANALPEDQRKEFTKSVGIPDSLLRKYSSMKQKEQQQQYMGNPNANRQSLVSSVKDKYIQSPNGQMFPSAIWNQSPLEQKKFLAVYQLDENGNAVKDRFGNPQVNFENPFIQAAMATAGDLQAVPHAVAVANTMKSTPIKTPDQLPPMDKNLKTQIGIQLKYYKELPADIADQIDNIDLTGLKTPEEMGQKILSELPDDIRMNPRVQSTVNNWVGTQRQVIKADTADKVWDDLSKRYNEISPTTKKANAWLSPDGKLIDTKEHIRIESVPSAQKIAGQGGYEDAMKNFMENTNGIRVAKNGSDLNVQWQTAPTKSQVDALQKTLNVNGGRVFFDTPQGKSGFFDYMKPSDAITSLKKLFQADNNFTASILRGEPGSSIIPQLQTIYNSQKGTLSPELDSAYQSLLQKYAAQQLTPEQLAAQHISQ